MEINVLKPQVTAKFDTLKKCKIEIQSLEKHIKTASDRLTADFEHWHSTAVRNSFAPPPSGVGAGGGGAGLMNASVMSGGSSASKADQFSDPTVRANVLAFERQVASVKAQLNS